MKKLVEDLSDGVRLIQLMVRPMPQLEQHQYSYVSTGDYGYFSVFVIVDPGHLKSSHLGDTSLGRYNKSPRMRVQKAENVNKALEFITSRGVKLTNIGPEGA